MKQRLTAWAVAAICLLVPVVAMAQKDIHWRSSSVQGPRTPATNTRLGVAIFGNAEPATYERKVSPVGLPVAGKLPIRAETVFRFADGSTLTMHSTETINLTAQGTHGRDEWTGDGQIVGGTGRYQGANGNFTFRALMGLDRQADGLLGDGFLTGQGQYTLQNPQ
jgi:hypothetical protein